VTVCIMCMATVLIIEELRASLEFSTFEFNIIVEASWLIIFLFSADVLQLPVACLSVCTSRCKRVTFYSPAKQREDVSISPCAVQFLTHDMKYCVVCGR